MNTSCNAIRERIKTLLYKREHQVFQLLADWKRGHEIAKEMHISIKTFETYVTRLRIAFDCRDLLEVRKVAVEHYAAFPDDRKEFPQRILKGPNPQSKTINRISAGIYGGKIR